MEWREGKEKNSGSRSRQSSEEHCNQEGGVANQRKKKTKEVNDLGAMRYAKEKGPRAKESLKVNGVVIWPTTSSSSKASRTDGGSNNKKGGEGKSRYVKLWE